jgi:hypothetical protein
MMYQDTISEALKWALIVFAAGFIGFFGKYLGKIILTLFHKGNEPDGKPEAPASPAPLPGPDAKAMKKENKSRLKEQKKQDKKGLGNEGD